MCDWQPPPRRGYPLVCRPRPPPGRVEMTLEMAAAAASSDAEEVPRKRKHPEPPSGTVLAWSVSPGELFVLQGTGKDRVGHCRVCQRDGKLRTIAAPAEKGLEPLYKHVAAMHKARLPRAPHALSLATLPIPLLLAEPARTGGGGQVRGPHGKEGASDHCCSCRRVERRQQRGGGVCGSHTSCT